MNEKIKAIIIDDEKDGRTVLSTLIKLYCPQVEIIGESSSGEQGLIMIEELNPALVFLDIDMPGMNGFSLLKKLKEINFEVIFVTAHHHYALKAIKHSALDYLLKPVDKTELIEAIGKFKISSSVNERMAYLLENETKDLSELKQIILNVREGYVFSEINEIVRCEADGNYTTVFFKNGDKQVASKTLKEFENLLSEHNFWRIHKSHLINLKYLKKYIKGEGGGNVVMTDNSEIEVSRRNKDAFLKKFNL
ncbi:LytTR family DNA-binding domain-containing protein [uncultured Cytophaga sp.]|uniref:LytR/AlgR family response regulator transcription factor n=1 Tax=uncultured Cytophaga sp. TaxID=160238 RepID=UPI002616BEE1|nr:LytTR family DNA-binding domain-containing protein [uncultured Cytophaga sp.]